MIAMILNNLIRRPTRTVFTAAGIAVGVATIVALLSFTQGLRNTAAGLTHLGGSELAVFQANVSDPTTSVLPESLVSRLRSKPYVASATPLLLIVEGVRQEPGSIVFGAEPTGFFTQRLVLVSGRRTPASSTSGILVGERLAESLSLSPGFEHRGERPPLHRGRDLPLRHLLRGRRGCAAAAGRTQDLRQAA